MGMVFRAAAVAVLAAGVAAGAQSTGPNTIPAAISGAKTDAKVGGPPARTGGIFPLRDVKRGLMATAWTVFEGTQPEAMDVEILGVLRGGRGPGHDMILARLHGTKPEYTGVVAGMSGSPVYVGDKLLGSLSYRIGQFSKEPIAGITPIEQMLEVRDLQSGAQEAGKSDEVLSHPLRDTTAQRMGHGELSASDASLPVSREDRMQAPAFQMIDTPLVMSGFAPEAVRLWQDRMQGTGLEVVAAGGGSSAEPASAAEETAAIRTIVPGSAVSLQLVRGDVEIAATCTVTYVDAKQLLACGHPIQQLGAVSLPMTATEVVATLPSPLNAFKIINTGAEIGAFTEDRDSGIKGVFGAKAHMIPVHVGIHDGGKTRNVNFEVLDQSSLTAQAVLVSVYNSLLQTNTNASDTSYHVTGKIAMDELAGGSHSGALEAPLEAPIDAWASGGDGQPAPLMAALGTAQDFNQFYANSGRQGTMRRVDLDVEVIPRRVSVELESARVVSNNIVHAGDTVTVEATVRPYQQAARNVRIPVTLPGRLQPGTVRVLVSDAGTLDRTLDPPKLGSRPMGMEAALAQANGLHAADRIYVSLLTPETQAGVAGRTLTSLPLSMANALETLRAGQEATLNGESAVVAADAAADGVLTGFQVLTLEIE